MFVTYDNTVTELGMSPYITNEFHAKVVIQKKFLWWKVGKPETRHYARAPLGEVWYLVEGKKQTSVHDQFLIRFLNNAVHTWSVDRV